MADDFDIEAMLEAPYKKVGNRTRRFNSKYEYCLSSQSLVMVSRSNKSAS
uniref:RNA binding motif protein 39b n=1 Tax=Electrophorus electricus TaxID=8005 RepID=A0AAY5EP42_ELEEL